MRKHIALLLAAIMLCCVSAFAHNVPDLNREGSIRVTMRCEGKSVPGGTLTLYRVGDVQEEDGNFSFRLSEDFAGSEASLETLNAALAEALMTYARNEDPEGTTADIDREGRVEFPGLKAGLYLLVQEEAASGYFRADPFLVSIPMTEDGKYVYDVDASPKVEVVEKPDPPDRPPHETPPPDEPPLSEPPGESPTEPPEEPPTAEIPDEPLPLIPGLPQTGQLNWPVPILAVLGMALLSLGFLVKRSGYEK